MGDKPIYWIGTSREDISRFPEEAKRKAGFQLRAIQKGESPMILNPSLLLVKGQKKLESG